MSRWTNEEIQFIEENYLKLSDKEISDILGTHTECAVVTKRKKLNLIKTNKKYAFEDVINECCPAN